MNLNWSNRVIKYVLFIFNLLFVISGIIMIAVGVSVKAYYTDYDIFLSGSYFSLPNLLIAIGSLIFFISFFGCCGAIRESWFMIFMFSILLSLIFIMEFSAGIAGYVLRDNTASYLEKKLEDTMKKYDFNENTTSAVTIMWDTIQSDFQCCGATGPKNWYTPHTPTQAPTTHSVPISSTPNSTISPTSEPSTSSENSTETSTNSTELSSESSGNKKRRDIAQLLVTLPDILATDKNFDLPMSCCKSKHGVAGQVVCNLNDESTAVYYKKGCVKGFGDFLKEHAVTLGGVGIAIALIQLFGVVFACHLAKQLKHGFYST